MKSKTSKSAKILKMLADGISVKDAAKKAGTSPNYVYFVKWRAANPTGKKLSKSRRKVAKEKVVEKTWKVALPEQPPAENFFPEEQDPLKVQIGGNHYRHMEIQPIQYIVANELGFLEGCIVKRVTRWRTKGGIEDLEKIKHEVDLLIKFEEESAPF